MNDTHDSASSFLKEEVYHFIGLLIEFVLKHIATICTFLGVTIFIVWLVMKSKTYKETEERVKFARHIWQERSIHLNQLVQSDLFHNFQRGLIYGRIKDELENLETSILEFHQYSHDIQQKVQFFKIKICRLHQLVYRAIEIEEEVIAFSMRIDQLQDRHDELKLILQSSNYLFGAIKERYLQIKEEFYTLQKIANFPLQELAAKMNHLEQMMKEILAKGYFDDLSVHQKMPQIEHQIRELTGELKNVAESIEISNLMEKRVNIRI